MVSQPMTYLNVVTVLLFYLIKFFENINFQLSLSNNYVKHVMWLIN